MEEYCIGEGKGEREIEETLIANKMQMQAATNFGAEKRSPLTMPPFPSLFNSLPLLLFLFLWFLFDRANFCLWANRGEERVLFEYIAAEKGKYRNGCGGTHSLVEQ